LFENIIDACKKLNVCFSHNPDLTDEQVEYGTYWRLELAYAIIKDLGPNDAERIAKIMLAVAENNYG